MQFWLQLLPAGGGHEACAVANELREEHARTSAIERSQTLKASSGKPLGGSNPSASAKSEP